MATEDKIEKVVEKVLESGAVEKVLQKIDAIAIKLGTTAEHLWVILVKQAYVTFIGYSIRYVLAIIFLCCMVKFFPYMYRKFTHEDWCAESTSGGFLIATFVICMIITVVAATGAVANITYTISLYFNPEYFAFQRIAAFID